MSDIEQHHEGHTVGLKVSSARMLQQFKGVIAPHGSKASNDFAVVQLCGAIWGIMV